jgi:hypothetical protein
MACQLVKKAILYHTSDTYDLQRLFGHRACHRPSPVQRFFRGQSRQIAAINGWWKHPVISAWFSGLFGLFRPDSGWTVISVINKVKGRAGALNAPPARPFVRGHRCTVSVTPRTFLTEQV